MNDQNRLDSIEDSAKREATLQKIEARIDDDSYWKSYLNKLPS
jgi:hypothetical protein